MRERDSKRAIPIITQSIMLKLPYLGNHELPKIGRHRENTKGDVLVGVKIQFRTGANYELL